MSIRLQNLKQKTYHAATNSTLISSHLHTMPMAVENIWTNRSDSLIFLVFQRYTASLM